MELKHAHMIALAAFWTSGTLAAGFVAGLTSPAAWAALSLAALLPSFLILRIEAGPAQTISQQIQEARR